MFYECNGIGTTSNVTNMQDMFNDMSYLFNNKNNFNGNISKRIYAYV